LLLTPPLSPVAGVRRIRNGVSAVQLLAALRESDDADSLAWDLARELRHVPAGKPDPVMIAALEAAQADQVEKWWRVRELAHIAAGIAVLVDLVP
jgi:hypothetical protein